MKVTVTDTSLLTHPATYLAWCRDHLTNNPATRQPRPFQVVVREVGAFVKIEIPDAEA